MKSQTIITKRNTVKNIMVMFTLMLSGVALAQTTVTLEDQCNCEVLQGTDVSTPGALTPTGADLGDLYVNTATGTIYFWDGDSWELTSATDMDNQQVLDFSYDAATRTLTLELEDGGAPITAVLPAESLTTLTLNGNSLEYLDEDNNTNIIPLNTGSLALGADGNSLDYTNENNVTTNIALNVGALTFDPATRELVYFDETGGQTFIALPSEAITTITETLPTGNAIGVYENENAELVTINETITSIVDNNDGNVTLVNEAGASVTIAKSDITANPDGTYTFTNNDGSDVIIDTNGLVISNLVAGNRIATFTEADGTVSDINETITDITGTSTTGNEIGLYEKEDGTTVSIQETITSIVDNNDGNVTLVNEAGASVTIAKSDITANPDGTYTFTNNDGSDVIIDTNGLVISNLVAGNRIATFTEADGTVSDINETITSIVDNNDGNVTLVNEAGASVTIAKSDITANPDGTYTFTNNDGSDVIIDTNGLVISNLVAGNRIATFTEADGTVSDINETITSIVDNNDGNVTLVNEAGASVTIAKSDITANPDGTYTFTNNDGSDVIIDTNGLVISNLVAGNRIATFTEADGTVSDINETITDITGTSTTGNEIGLYEKEDGTTVSIQETITSIVDNNDGNVTLVNEAGASVTIAKSDITANPDGTYTFTNNDGSDVIIDTNGLVISNLVAGNRIATFTEADGTVSDINETITDITGTSTTGNEIGLYEKEDGTTVSIQETITSIVDNNDGNVTLVNEAGASVTIAKSDITANPDGTYTFTNNDGSDVIIDTNGLVISNLVAGNRIATFTEADGTVSDINETITSIVDNNDGNVTLVNEAGASVTIAKSDITANPDGTYTFTNNDGSDVIIDTNGLVISNLVAGNRIATFTEADGTVSDINETITDITGTSTTGNEIGLYEKEDGTTVSIQETITSIVDNNDGNVTLVNEAGASVTIAKSDITANPDGTYTFTNNDGSDVIIDTNGLVISNLVVGNRIATFTEADGTVSDINETITSIVDNNDGNVTLVNEAGASVTIAKSDITANPDGTYTFTNNDGSDVIIDTNGLVISNLVAGNRIATFTEADGTVSDINETITDITGTSTTGNEIGLYEKEDGTTVSIQETITSIVDNNDGNVTLVNEAGASVTIAKSDITANPDGTYTFTNNDGSDVIIDTNGLVISNLVAGNRIATFTEADGTVSDINETITDITGTSTTGNEIGLYEKEDGTTVSIQETITSIVDNNDGNVTLVNEAGASVTIAKSDITANPDGTYTFTNNDGSDVIIDTNGLVISNLVAGNRIATFTEADGTVSDINETITDITGTSTTGNEIGLYEKEDGTTVSIQETITSIVDNNDGNVTLVNEAGASVTIAKSDITANPDGTYTFTNNDGSDVIIDTNGLVISNLVAGNRIATFTEADGTVSDINETITSIVDNNDGNVTLVNEAGASVTIAKSDITANPDGTYTFTNNDGSDVIIDTNGLVISNLVVGNRIATFTEADGTVSDINETITDITGTSTTGNEIGLYEKEDGTTVSIQETITSIVDNNDGNVTLVNESGASVTIAKSDITANPDGTYTFTNNDGSDVIIDTNGLVISNLVAGNRIATFTEADGTVSDINETITDITGTSTTGNEIGLYEKEDGTTVSIQETITSIVDNNDGNVTLVNEAGASVTIAKSDITANPDGTYTFTNNDGSDVIIDTNGLVISNLVAGNRIATFTEADGTVSDINETITTLSDANSDGIFDFVSENSTITSFDGTDDQEGTEVPLTTNTDFDGDTIEETNVEEALNALSRSGEWIDGASTAADGTGILAKQADLNGASVFVGDNGQVRMMSEDFSLADDLNSRFQSAIFKKYSTDIFNADSADQMFDASRFTINADATDIRYTAFRPDLIVAEDYSGSTLTDLRGIWGGVNVNGTAGSSVGTVWGITGAATYRGEGTVNNLTALWGLPIAEAGLATSMTAIRAQPIIRGTGSAAYVRGVHVIVSKSLGLTADNVYAIDINSQVGISTTDNYGLRIGNISGATNNYAMYTNTGQVSFGDNLQLRNIQTGLDTDTILVSDATGVIKSVGTVESFATDAEVTTAVSESEALDLDKVIGNESVTGLAFDGTTLTLTQDGAGPETVNLASIKDHDWYEVGTATAPNDINDNIFTQGNVGIGTETLTSKLTIAGADNGALSLSGTQPSIFFNDTDGGFNTFTFQNSGVNRTAMGRRNDDAFYITMNNGSWNNDSFVILNSNQNVGLGVNIPTAKLDVNGDVRVRSLAVGANTNSIVTANADGVLEVIGSADSFATDTEVADSVNASAALDLDKVIGNESVTGLAFDGTTLTLTQDGAADETVDLSSVAADNIYSDDGVLTANRTLNMSTFDLDFDGVAFLDQSTSSLGIGSYANEVIESVFQGASNQTGNGSLETAWVYAQGIEAINEKGAQSTAIILSQDGNFNTGADEVTIVTDGDAQLRVSPAGSAVGVLRLEKYGNNGITGNPTTLIGVEADGDLVEVNSLKASKVFYPPSIAIDASVTGTFSVDLYAQYIAQFGSPVVSSGGTIPTYNANELDYHVTFADPAVFNTATMSISALGVLTYTVDAPPADYNSLINVVFVVK